MRNVVRSSILSACSCALLAASLVHRAGAQARVGTAPSDTGVARSRILPVVESSGFLVLLNLYDRYAYANEVQDGKKVYSSTFRTTWDHLRQQRWVHDQDPFNVNQFEHPYQGATMYGLARSSGHGFWTGLIQANVGSFIWKMAGETDPPSINDMITTGQAGSLLGEALYRMSDLVRKDTPNNRPSRWHDLLADAVSPPTAVNRRIFGDRFRVQLADSAPATSWQVRLGATADALSHDYASPISLLRRDASAELSMSYGLPGKPGYVYERPLDYFDFQLSVLSNTKNPVENVMLRALLLGTATASSERSRGIWGLYGTYDYISPYLFRVSSTAASLGTTQQLWLTPDIAFQTSALAGIGYGAAGSTTVVPSTPTNAAIRDYHFGVTPQALLTGRFILGDRAMIDLGAREYYVSGLGSDDTHGSETIFRGNVGIDVRVIGGHTLGVRYVASTRNAKYGSQADASFSEGTIAVAYSFLGSNHFSAVKW